MENSYTPTPHNEAQFGEIARTVLMPGDPLRAKYIAENWLDHPICFNSVRNMLGFTGTYQGKKVSVMGAGMGMPSMGIYSYELFHFYGVDRIVRIGSAGALQPEIKLKDLVVALGVSTDSGYPAQLGLPGTFAPLASFDLLERAVHAAKARNTTTWVGNVLSSDLFYNFDPDTPKKWAAAGVLAIEMETAALYVNAAHAKKQAVSLLSISDHFCTGQTLCAEERRTAFSEMIEVALALV